MLANSRPEGIMFRKTLEWRMIKINFQIETKKRLTPAFTSCNVH